MAAEAVRGIEGGENGHVQGSVEHRNRSALLGKTFLERSSLEKLLGDTGGEKRQGKKAETIPKDEGRDTKRHLLQGKASAKAERRAKGGRKESKRGSPLRGRGGERTGGVWIPMPS